MALNQTQLRAVYQQLAQMEHEVVTAEEVRERLHSGFLPLLTDWKVGDIVVVNSHIHHGRDMVITGLKIVMNHWKNGDNTLTEVIRVVAEGLVLDADGNTGRRTAEAWMSHRFVDGEYQGTHYGR